MTVRGLLMKAGPDQAGQIRAKAACYRQGRGQKCSMNMVKLVYP